jgi:hypothetical protein
MEHREMKVQLNSIHEKVSEQCFEMWQYGMEEWFGASIDYYEGNKLYIV